MEVRDKIVIVTGASSGIGLATAKLLSEKGAKVALVARSKEKLERLSKELPESFVVIADLSKEDEVRMMVQEVLDHYGRVDVLVNNAGIGYDAAIEKIEPQKFRELLELDLISPLIAMEEVIPIMRKHGQGSIVNISSGTALMALPEMGAYSSTKRALVGLSLTAREELKSDGIAVSVVYPYATKTNFEKNTMHSGVDYPEMDEDNMSFEIDSAEYVSEKILEAVESGDAEVFAHEWMQQR